jgi:hypothetical protein
LQLVNHQTWTFTSFVGYSPTDGDLMVGVDNSAAIVP